MNYARRLVFSEAAGPMDCNPLKNSCVVHTSDPEEACHALTTVFGALSFNLLPSEAPFESRAHDYLLSHGRVSYFRHKTAARFDVPESSSVRQYFRLGGRSETRFGRTSIVMADHGDSGIIPAYTEARTAFTDDYKLLLVKIGVEALTSKLTALLGAAPSRDLVFDPGSGSRRPEAQHLWRMVLLIVRELDTMGASPPRYLLTELEQTLMVYFLVGNGHNHSHLLQRKAMTIAPWQVRRAEEFMAANWQRPITVEEIATATGASVRSIFRSFQVSRGYTPTAFLKRIRLERARDMLRAAGARTSVTGVAFACGFHNLGHFARDYRYSFGELPSETLNGKRD
jgi:AraC-like DNA-binding protein